MTDNKTKLHLSLETHFPYIDTSKNNVVIGDSNKLCGILNDVFKYEDVFYHKYEDVKLIYHDVTVAPLTFNYDDIYFVMPYSKLNKFIKKVNKLIKKFKKCTNGAMFSYHYFICVKDGNTFVVTNDYDIIMEITQFDHGI